MVTALILGIVQMAVGLQIATEIMGPREALSHFQASSTGEIINKGTYTPPSFAFALGVVREIGYALGPGDYSISAIQIMQGSTKSASAAHQQPLGRIEITSTKQ
jgi:hypothetical protein